jgi:hypothetical protein
MSDVDWLGPPDRTGWTDWTGTPLYGRQPEKACRSTKAHTPHSHDGLKHWCRGRDSEANGEGRLPGCRCSLTGPPLPEGSKVYQVDPSCPLHHPFRSLNGDTACVAWLGTESSGKACGRTPDQHTSVTARYPKSASGIDGGHQNGTTT